MAPTTKLIVAACMLATASAGTLRGLSEGAEVTPEPQPKVDQLKSFFKNLFAGAQSEGECLQTATLKWGLTKEKMCVNICKGGEVKFDWSHNEKSDLGPGTATHNVFAVTKKGYETCKQRKYDFAQADYLGGWDDPTNIGGWKSFAKKPNPGTADSNGNFYIHKNIQPPTDGSNSLYFGCNMGNGKGFGCTGGIKAIVNVETPCEGGNVGLM